MYDSLLIIYRSNAKECFLVIVGCISHSYNEDRPIHSRVTRQTNYKPLFTKVHEGTGSYSDMPLSMTEFYA